MFWVSRNYFEWEKSPKIFTNRSGQAEGVTPPPPPSGQPDRFFTFFFFDLSKRDGFFSVFTVHLPAPEPALALSPPSSSSSSSALPLFYLTIPLPPPFSSSLPYNSLVMPYTPPSLWKLWCATLGPRYQHQVFEISTRPRPQYVLDSNHCWHYQSNT